MWQALEEIYVDGVRDGEKEGRVSIISQMIRNGLSVSEIRKSRIRAPGFVIDVVSYDDLAAVSPAQ